MSRIQQPIAQEGDDAKKLRGAQHTQETTVGLLQSWLHHHKVSCRDSLRRLLAFPIQSLLTWLVIAIAIALPAALYLVLQNVQQLGQGWQSGTQMSVFLVNSASENAVQHIVQRLQQHEQVQRVETITPASALSEFRQYSGLADALTHLDENPLPTVLVLQPSATVDTPEKLSRLQGIVSVEPLVQSVQLDMGWLQRLYGLLSLGERVVFVLAALLAFGVLLIIGNTLRLAIENRRDEIVVVKMVGGTDSFIRRPFLYTGFWYGVGGGLLAVVLLWLADLWISTPIHRLIFLYSSGYSPHGLGVSGVVVLMLMSSVLGLLAAWLAVTCHLRAIEPS